MNQAPDTPPVSWGSFEDAEALRRWAFLRRTPAQRLGWLVEMLEIAYRTGAIRPHQPALRQRENASSAVKHTI